MNPHLAPVYGALTIMSVLAALFFLRYWWLSKDRFFIWFACAFATFGLNWTLIVYDHDVTEHTPCIYGIRLLGFLQILVAILFKNRSASS